MYIYTYCVYIAGQRGNEVNKQYLIDLFMALGTATAHMGAWSSPAMPPRMPADSLIR